MLALPALAWISMGRFLRRATSPEAKRSIWFAAVGALGAGALLSLAFTYGSVDHATHVMLLILLSGALLPLYRAEYLLSGRRNRQWCRGPGNQTLEDFSHGLCWKRPSSHSLEV